MSISSTRNGVKLHTVGVTATRTAISKVEHVQAFN